MQAVQPALLPTWEAELGWSKTDLSAGFTLALVASALLAPLAGRLIDHGHGRAVLAVYTMQRQDDGAWRINGCRLYPAPGPGV